jgi:hypothetical protein
LTKITVSNPRRSDNSISKKLLYLIFTVNNFILANTRVAASVRQALAAVLARVARTKVNLALTQLSGKARLARAREPGHGRNIVLTSRAVLTRLLHRTHTPIQSERTLLHRARLLVLMPEQIVGAATSRELLRARAMQVGVVQGTGHRVEHVVAQQVLGRARIRNRVLTIQANLFVRTLADIAVDLVQADATAGRARRVALQRTLVNIRLASQAREALATVAVEVVGRVDNAVGVVHALRRRADGQTESFGHAVLDRLVERRSSRTLHLLKHANVRAHKEAAAIPWIDQVWHFGLAKNLVRARINKFFKIIIK